MRARRPAETLAQDAAIAALRREPCFARLIDRHGLPTRRPRTSLFEALARAIIYQQVSGRAAATIFARFKALFPGGRFPTPEAVLALPPERLRAAGLSAQKAAYLRDAAQKLADGTIKRRALRAMGSDALTEHLCQVKGVGTWTAHMLLISTFGRPDVLPTGDLGIQKGFALVYGLARLPSPEAMERLARPWRAHASVACWYLWRAADEAYPAGRPKPRTPAAGRKRRYTAKQ